MRIMVRKAPTSDGTTLTTDDAAVLILFKFLRDWARRRRID
jgi:hypothetical protein